MQTGNSNKTIPTQTHLGKISKIWQRLGIAIAVVGSCADNALAQVESDGTLSTKVNRNGTVWEITEGDRPKNGDNLFGDNLFHSFGEFSLPNGETAFFNNATDVVNIIGRVTGGNLSAIDGLIKANGGANLILLNPAGISFGANARLDIGGSFLGSSAESLMFEGGIFSATDTENSILTVSAPLGLQMGRGSGAIRVAGTGNQITETELSSPLDLGDSSGLEVSSGQTLALVGNQLFFDGGIVTAESGFIELGSVAEGEVALDRQSGTGWSLNYNDVAAFAEVRLSSAALANASSTQGISGGSIGVRGSRVSLSDGSSLLIQNTASTAAGSIDVLASEAVTLRGSNDNSTNSSNIVNEPLGAGSGGNININAPSLSLADGAFISTTAYGSGGGGNLNINNANSISLVGRGLPELIQTFQVNVLNKTLQPSDRGTGLFIGTAGSGDSGSLNLDTSSLRLTNGSIIHSPTFTEGVGGDINIAANRIELDSSAIQAGAVQDSIASTMAGNINIIETTELDIRDGAVIIDITLGAAAGGNIDIDAESIELQNSPANAAFLTGIYANSSVGSGTAGEIVITTERLRIDDAFISNSSGLALLDNTVVRSGGTGGDITIEASEINIRGIPFDPTFSSGIGSTTFSNSNAGNINITTDRLSVADGGDITTTTLGGGDGGDLIIDASEYIDVAGTLAIGEIRRGGLFAASGRASFPDLVATGEAGAIEIYTPDLTIRDGASIDVQSLGTGGTGELNVVADTIAIDNQGAITAETQSGVGGNIFLEADNIFWRRQSTTTASAGGSGDGGNIIIEADNLVALESSRLIADAAAGGDGGNILVNTQSLFICPSCQVSASSTLGVDGIVTFNVLEPETNLEFTDLPEQPALPEEVVALACSSPQNQQTSELTIVGRGGLPPRPSEPLTGESLISFSPSENSNEVTQTPVEDSEFPAPASGWYINSEGTVVLVSRALNPASGSRFNTADCRVP